MMRVAPSWFGQKPAADADDAGRTVVRAKDACS